MKLIQVFKGEVKEITVLRETRATYFYQDEKGREQRLTKQEKLLIKPKTAMGEPSVYHTLHILNDGQQKEAVEIAKKQLVAMDEYINKLNQFNLKQQVNLSAYIERLS